MELRDLIIGPSGGQPAGQQRPPMGLSDLIIGRPSGRQQASRQRPAMGVMDLVIGRRSARRQARYELRRAEWRRQVTAEKDRILTRRANRSGFWHHFWEIVSGSPSR